ncbi:MAG: permease prefix domain 1-containing protein [Cyanobacteria bacterium]|nr:permease prefix domain 1-containing protein [Cyanobacteriota bacterium]
MIERRRLDEDMRQEIDAHIESLAEGYRRQGMSADAAYLAARRQFGNIARLRQDIREMNQIPWIEHTTQEVRYAVRLLWRAKGVHHRCRVDTGAGLRRHDGHVRGSATIARERSLSRSLVTDTGAVTSAACRMSSAGGSLSTNSRPSSLVS